MKYVERIVAEWYDADLRKKWGTICRNETAGFFCRTRWDVFWTQTFRNQTSEWGARAKWLSFLADFNSRLALSQVLWVVEPHVNSDSHHVHSLLSMRLPLSFSRYELEWRSWKEEAWKNLGKAFLLRTTRDAPIWYVTKYLMKDAPSYYKHLTPERQPKEKMWGLWTPDDPVVHPKRKDFR